MIREMHRNGMSISEISRRLGIDRKTVRKYLKSDNVPKYTNTRERSSKIEPFLPTVKELISKYNLSAVRIHEDLVRRGFNGSYSLVKRYARLYRNDRALKAVYRFETKPGEQSQVDFGEFGYIEMDGKRMKLYAFSMILGYSRMRYVEFTTDISTANVIKMHINAFNYFGGYTSTILYDNLKQVVTERKIPSSKSNFNKRFMDFAEHYGFYPRLCYPYRAQTKGKIENTIKFIRNNFFAGREFSSLQDLNNLAAEWLKKVNSSIHRTTGRIPLEMLNEEKLMSIPETLKYGISLSETRKISRDCFISYKGNRYSVPWKYAGRIAIIKEGDSITITVDGTVVATHDILTGTGRISRKKEHFEGLLKNIRDENIMKFSQDVEKRDLRKYEVI